MVYLNLLVGYITVNMALDQGKLKDNIKSAIEDTLQPALETAMLKQFGKDTKESTEKSKEFADTVIDLFADPFAEALSSAIDYYVRNADVHGQMMLLGVNTVGSMCAQSQVVPLMLKASTHPVGQGGGMIPMLNEFYLGIK